MTRHTYSSAVQVGPDNNEAPNQTETGSGNKADYNIKFKSDQHNATVTST